MERTILHVDLNSFYASVVCFFNPAIRDKPVVVGGDEAARHGIVLAANQIAKKKYGIKTAEPIIDARRKCRDLVCVPADYDLFLKYSGLAREIYYRYTDQIESFGIDECWLDVTASRSLFGDGKKIADDLRRTIRAELGITASIGVSFCKIISKLGSDYKKPDATTVITKDGLKGFGWLLPASELLYVGPSTTKKLTSYGIETIGDLAKAETDLLKRVLGKWGLVLKCFANGIDDSPVSLYNAESNPVIKSVGNSRTLHRDVKTTADVKRVFYMLSETVAARLREYGLKATTIQVSLRDNGLYSVERQAKLQYPSFLAHEIAEKALEIYLSKYDMNKPLRSIGVRGCNLVPKNAVVQLDLFGDIKRQKREERFAMAIDDLRRRFGDTIIQRGIMYEDKKLTGLDTSEHKPHPETIHPISYFGAGSDIMPHSGKEFLQVV